MLTVQEIEILKKSSLKTRRNILKMVHAAKSGHPGGSLSAVEIITLLYHKCLNIPKEWDKAQDYDNRDRFILSKGHASPVLYSVLADIGIIEEENLLSFRKFGSELQGHPSLGHLKGVEASTGSLGQGLSIASGIAIGLKLNQNNAKVVVYLGDGEVQEGSCWESFMQAAHRNLNNLIVFIDRNNLQIDGCTEKIMALGDLKSKLEAFNWNVSEIDGHDYNQIYKAYNEATLSEKPSVIIANTIKGKGISFMENAAGWHGKAPNDEQLQKALEELK